MLQILIIFGWLIAVGCLLLLAKEALRTRFSRSRPSKTPTKKSGIFRRRGRFDQSLQDVAGPVPPQTYVRFGTKAAGYVLLLLWEAFWISEILERSSETAKPLRLPYVFLLIVMVGVPLAAYFAARKILRRRAEAA
jgi:hypothetical protein